MDKLVYVYKSLAGILIRIALNLDCFWRELAPLLCWVLQFMKTVCLSTYLRLSCFLLSAYLGGLWLFSSSFCNFQVRPSTCFVRFTHIPFSLKHCKWPCVVNFYLHTLAICIEICDWFLCVDSISWNFAELHAFYKVNALM